MDFDTLIMGDGDKISLLLSNQTNGLSKICERLGYDKHILFRGFRNGRLHDTNLFSGSISINMRLSMVELVMTFYSQV